MEDSRKCPPRPGKTLTFGRKRLVLMRVPMKLDRFYSTGLSVVTPAKAEGKRQHL